MIHHIVTASYINTPLHMKNADMQYEKKRKTTSDYAPKIISAVVLPWTRGSRAEKPLRGSSAYLLVLSQAYTHKQLQSQPHCIVIPKFLYFIGMY